MTQSATTRLRKLGERRQRHIEEQERLAGEIRQALEATEGIISRSHAADLLGIERSTLYRTYLSTVARHA